MRILITGANGYIGKSLREALRGKHYVSVITRNEVDLTKATEVKAFFDKSHFFDIVLHFQYLRLISLLHYLLTLQPHHQETHTLDLL